MSLPQYYPSPPRSSSSTHFIRKEKGPFSPSRTSPHSESSPGLRRPQAQFSQQRPVASIASTISASSLAHSIADKYSLSSDPRTWGSDLSPHTKESDDFLHNPDPRRDKRIDHGGTLLTTRGVANLGCLVILSLALFGLFAGYPITQWILRPDRSSFGGFNIGGLNASGQVPAIAGNFGLVDVDTPRDVYTKRSYRGDKKMQLVFSDEFNVDGRSFYPGDDPYWEAVDLHYWATGNLEWYDPGAAATRNGALELTLSRKDTHDLNYEGAMIQSWNKFCFTGGLVETAVTLPGSNNIQGLWPAVWMMGNLGRAGYGASLEGMWPYSYDACDVGTAPNQTIGGLPRAALTSGDPNPRTTRGALSYLPGQRLSRCTCPGEEHPGPTHTDGSYVGRAAPEIDFFEAQVETGVGGHVSLSAQWAPFNAAYEWFNETNAVITDPDVAHLNAYKGGIFQQATSVVAETNQDCYEFDAACFSVYGIEYVPGFDDAYISWLADGVVAWTLLAPGMAADPRVEIDARPVPNEPMYLIANLGISEAFGTVDFENLIFPTVMRIDYIRVYQEEDKINVGCDPPDFPTSAYIERFPEAYTQANFTTWVDDYGKPFPRNRLVDGCA